MASKLGVPYPEGSIEKLWLSLFEFTGHAHEAILEEDHKKIYARAERTLIEARELTNETACALAKKLARGADGENILINTSCFDRTETVMLHLTSAFGIGSIKLKDRFGKDIDYQICECYTGDKATYSLNAVDLAAAVFVPAYSYNTVYISENVPYLQEKIDRTYHTHSGKSPRDHRETLFIDNGVFKAFFEKGFLMSLTLPGGSEMKGCNGVLFHLAWQYRRRQSEHRR
jgi:hypothetical protein